MDSLTPPPPPVQLPSPPKSVLKAWTRPAQLTAAFFFTLAFVLLALRMYGASRWACKPLEVAAGPIYQIDLNHADRAELLQLPGIGPQLADRIVQHRRQHGPFHSVDDFQHVSGIGPLTLERLRSWICVGPEGKDDAKSTTRTLTSLDSSPEKGSESGRGGGAKAAAL